MSDASTMITPRISIRSPLAHAPSTQGLNVLWDQGPARIGAGATLTAIDVTTVLPVVWRRQEWECLGDAVRHDVHAHDAWRTGEEVDAVAGMGIDVVDPTHDPNRDVSHVIVGSAPVRPAGPVCAQRRAEATLALGRGGRHAQIKPQQLRAGMAAVRATQRLTRVLEQDAHQVGAVPGCGAVE